jgi:hypothetical protein
VVVAPRAFDAQAEKRAPERVDAIHDVLSAVLLRNHTALLRLHVVPVESRREPLLLGRVRQQVARELPGDEAIERQIAVERGNHPVAPRPHLAHPVVLVAVRVGVACDVEPFGRHLLAVGGGGEEAIDHFLVSVGGAIGDEGIDLGQRGRQPGKIDGHATQPRLTRCLR